jgi:hypothetical protein
MAFHRFCIEVEEVIKQRDSLLATIKAERSINTNYKQLEILAELRRNLVDDNRSEAENQRLCAANSKLDEENMVLQGKVNEQSYELDRVDAIIERSKRKRRVLKEKLKAAEECLARFVAWAGEFAQLSPPPAPKMNCIAPYKCIRHCDVCGGVESVISTFYSNTLMFLDRVYNKHEHLGSLKCGHDYASLCANASCQIFTAKCLWCAAEQKE